MKTSLFRLGLDSRIEWVLKTYLRTSLDAVNAAIPSDERIPFPPTIKSGTDIIVLDRSQNAIDLYPAVCVYELSSRSTPQSFFNASDDIVRFGVAAAVASTGIDVAWSNRKSKVLALCAAEVLETYLPNAPGIAASASVYRVDVVSTNGPRSGPLRNTDLHLTNYIAQIDVYCRTTYGYAPALSPAIMGSEVVSVATDARFDPTPLIGVFRRSTITDVVTAIGNVAFGGRISLGTLTNTDEVRFDTATLVDSSPTTGPFPDGSIAIISKQPFGTTPVVSFTANGRITFLPSALSGPGEYTMTLYHATFGTVATYRFALE